MLPLLYAALCLMLLSVLTGVSGEQLTAVQTEVLSFEDAALSTQLLEAFVTPEGHMTQEEVCSSVSNHAESRKSCQRREQGHHRMLNTRQFLLLLWSFLQRWNLGCGFFWLLFALTSYTNPSLFWYKQDGTSGPQFILSRFTIGKGKTEDEFKERFPPTLNPTMKSAPLKIQELQLSDSAVYYCALRPTVTGSSRNCSVYRWLFQHTVRRTSCLLCFPETTWGQKISPVPGMKNGISSREGEDVTLRCNYETSDSYVYLYWYKHQSDYEAPQFILWKGARSNTGQHIPDKRYRCNTGQQESELTITDVTLADSAVYYCALRATETQRDEDAVQKPDKSYLTDHRQVHCSLSDTGYRAVCVFISFSATYPDPDRGGSSFRRVPRQPSPGHFHQLLGGTPSRSEAREASGRHPSQMPELTPTDSSRCGGAAVLLRAPPGCPSFSPYL
ncbi:hypothetical protein D4764_15G0006060 [Takifugu flavidus]|uniref:Ig-like domain-containing protein n=1 Tax=Takifugu flavidus TaxID=433684 RepID=A0A5C6P079_9TELE|nr:hypothetical protein D4764_15G0006060 [Takifugu flavidus]